jgi:hypothetical protein
MTRVIVTGGAGFIWIGIKAIFAVMILFLSQLY